MRILDEKGKEIQNPDLSIGYLVQESIVVKHHEATDYVPEQSHYEVVKEYENGGKDLELVIDVPEVHAQDAWDEYEDIQRYIQYTSEELFEIEQAKIREEQDRIEKERQIELQLERNEWVDNIKKDIPNLIEYINEIKQVQLEQDEAIVALFENNLINIPEEGN